MHKTMELAIANLSRASLFEAYATLTAVSSLISQFNSQFVPKAVRDYVYAKFSQWFTTTSCCKDSFTLVIDEYSRATYVEPNLLFQACQEYLSDKLRDKATRLKGFRSTPGQSNVSYQLACGEMFTETLENGIKLVWNYSCKNSKGEDVDVSSSRGETSRSFELTFDFCHKNEVLDGYIPSVLLKYYDQVIEMNKEIYLYTYQGVDSWRSVTFNHPFTFDSLALDPELKQSIIDDLDMFVRRKEFYNKVGKAWKRGYLLYGPPGTGKSSLVAAMANYLRFDVYDLQLGSVTSDQVLRRLMLSTSNKSILVIEDIDCTIGLSRALPSNSYDCNDDSGAVYSDDDREEEEDEDGVKNSKKYCQNKENQKNNVNAADSQISLSGLLNFIDGLWSSCGDERIIIFTTNHKGRLDPAMLRPGRMDMHIHMSYLTMKGFMVLANNYLGVSGEHPLFAEIETLLKRVNVTPAQVAEQLIRNEDADIALSMVVKMLKRRYRKQCQKTKKASKRKTRVVDSIEGNTNENNGVSTTKGKRKRKVDSIEAKTNENGASKTEKATTTKKKVKPILLD